MHNYYPDKSEDGTVVGVSCVVRDITELRQAEESLRESEALLRQAARTANLGHWSFDNTSGEYLSVSEEYAHIFGYTADEFLKCYRNLDQDMELVHPEDRAKVAEAYEKCDGLNIEYRIVRADGSVRTVHEIEKRSPDVPDRYHGTLQDMTERRSADEALLESEGLLRQAAHIAGLGHWRVDEVAGEFLSVSEEYARIFGYNSEEFMRRYRLVEQVMSVVHSEDRDRVMKEFQEIRSGQIEYRIIHADGSVRTVREEFQHILDESGRARESFGTMQDITELPQADRGLRRSRHEQTH